MANFMENLWGSVFTPGATPTLIVATNVTFAALQLLLLALLIATYSIHFGILSILSAGLWYSINWFATELQAAQAKEAEAERLRKQKQDWKTRGEVEDSADDEGGETETEGHAMRDSFASVADESMNEVASNEPVALLPGGQTTGASKNSPAALNNMTARQRRAEDGDRSGDVSSSTDSEWEKVDR